MKFGKQSAWSAAAVALAIALVAGVYLVAAQRARQDIHAAAGRQLQIVALDLESVLERFESLPFALSFHPDLARVLERPQDEALIRRVNQTLQSVQRQARVSAIYLMDENGLTLASSNWQQPYSFVGKNFSFRPYFRDALAGAAGRFYGIGNTTGEPGYFISQPVYRGEPEGGTPAGVIAVKIALGDFEQTWASSEEPIALADARGVVFLSNRADWRYHSLRPLDDPDQQRLVGTMQYAGQQILPIATLAEDAGEPVARPVGRLGWQLMQFPSPWRVTRAALAPTIAAALLLVVAALSWWALLQRRRRMEERSESRRALQRAADELEQKIAQRTSELEAKYAKLQEAERLLRSTQGELVQAGKLAMLGQMAAGITHELNQPLAAIRAFADNAVTFLARGNADKARANLSHIADASARMGALVGQLKGFARKSDVVAGVDLVHALRTSVMLLDNEIRRLAPALDIDAPDRLLVPGDPVRVEQVLINLLRNALDAVEERDHRHISVRMRCEGDEAVVGIRDSGAGIAQQVARHLFEPFFTTKPSGKGLGLGLAISSSIVQAMNGRLEARNTEQGGAEFILRLPLRSEVKQGEALAE
ncbi:sensor histidine kinase [Noviherbaspirillum aridicola]|uniref:histidine kinase n=1 Tax=Noviherbaspirillum aridicola TaxID=2849687 RepID=A0ABQ4Q1P1_9BURK|nr:ATP-binding protein [Noviherbaspirillum aridicola]GIZ50972.1 C4-dicarboxylate transport sensor kinase [Noviherbaspirillum aridicola]